MLVSVSAFSPGHAASLPDGNRIKSALAQGLWPFHSVSVFAVAFFFPFSSSSAMLSVSIKDSRPYGIP